MSDLLKTCSKCKIKKTIIQFNKDKRKKSGLTSRCRQCSSNYMKDRYQKNKSTILAKQRTPEYLKRAFERYKIRRAKYPFPVRAKEWRTAMKGRSKRNNLKYDIDFFTIDYLVNLQKTQSECECCKIKLDFTFKGDGIRTDNSPSLDRFDSCKGYIQSNVVMICWRCNRLKFDATITELETILVWMKSKK